MQHRRPRRVSFEMRWILVLLVACAKPPAPEVFTPPRAVRGAPRLTPVPRPQLQLPPVRAPLVGALDPEDHRWPLAHTPRSEPSADLVAMFDASGSWLDLCAARREPRWADRDDALAYLGAWCRHPNGPPPALLAPLAKSRSRRIAQAARADIVALLATGTDGKASLLWLGDHGLDDVEVLDALAAGYQLLGNGTAAIPVVEKLRAREMVGGNGDRCRRLLRDHLLTGRDIHERVALLAPTNETCARIQSALPRPDPDGRRRRELARTVYEGWPRAERRIEAWLAYTKRASALIDFPGMAKLVSAALENAALVANCATDVPAIVELARAARPHAPTDEALSYLAGLTEQSCPKRHSPTLDRR